MSPTNELQLRDIHLPDSVSWWPPAPGWWIVVFASILIIVASIAFYRYRKNRLLHKAAKQELEKIKQVFEQSSDSHMLVTSISVWLRRVSLTFYPRREVAGLTGQDWLEFLDKQFGKSKQSLRFNHAAGLAIINAPYQNNSDIDAHSLLELCHSWLQCLPRHRGVKT